MMYHLLTSEDPIPLPKDPPPLPRDPKKFDPAPSRFSTPHDIVEIKTRTIDTAPLGTADPTNITDGAGTGVTPLEPYVPPATHDIVRRGPQIVTRGDSLRPPYPEAKRMLGEEATLTLKLTIDAGGRVVAVEPIGKADPDFLRSARSHLLRVWRFEPATEDGKPVPSTKVITLRFELGDA
ncbi:MAG: TonB family protein [Sphingomonadales bacterium]|nr:TonB family protein [Sphingomonadales bacterium]